MKAKQLFLSAFALITVTTACTTDIEINEKNFPDENFRQWILSQEYGADGILTAEEIAGVDTLEIFGGDIQNLKGIEYFTEVRYLDCSCNELTTLDVSKNTNLTFLNCGKNKIKGKEMDALVESLQVVNNGRMLVIWIKDEQNEMTPAQVTKAKAKGWIPFIYKGWQEYAGSEE